MRRVPCHGPTVPPIPVVRAGGSLERAHDVACMGTSASLRALRLARSMRATTSAGMVSSTLSRQAKTTKVAYAPNAAKATIHQMCQISANPMKVAKKAQMNPVALFLGISMAE
jgi:hypothetical protein